MSCTDKMYLTGNEICSDNPRDLSDNARVFDAYVNSAEFSVTDRFGTPRLTLAGIEKKVDDRADDAIGRFEGEIDAIIKEAGGVEVVNRWVDSIEKVPSAGFIKGNLGYVTPEMFGAVGDGVTNDFDAIQAAFNEGGSSGKPVVLEGKTYCYNKQLRIRSNTDIRMARNTVLKTIGDGYTGLRLVDGDSSNIRISGGIVDMQGHVNRVEANSLAGGDGENLWIYGTIFRNITGFHAIDLNNYDNVIIDSCRFEGQLLVTSEDYFAHRREAIQLPGAGGHTDNYKIVNCYFGASEDMGSWRVAVGNHANASATESANNIIIQGNTFDGILYSALVIFGHEGWIVSNNIFTDCADGIRLEKGHGESHAVCRNILVQGNIANGGNDFIVINDKSDHENTNRHHNIKILGNICTSVTSNFVVSRGASDVAIIDNTVKELRRLLFTSDVVSEGFTVQGNTVISNTDPAIQLSIDTDIKIHNNYFKNSNSRVLFTITGKHSICISNVKISDYNSGDVIVASIALGGYCHINDITFEDSVFSAPPINVYGGSNNTSLTGVKVSNFDTGGLSLSKVPMVLGGLMPGRVTSHPAVEGSIIQVIREGVYIYSSGNWVKLGG